METVNDPQPDAAPPPESKAAPKKIRRWEIGTNVVVQIALVLFLALMVNYLGFQHYRRWDLSRDRQYALSDKSKAFLESVPGKIRITVFFGPANPIAQDVQNLLTQYQYAAKGKVDVENIDPERNLTRAREAFEKYKIVSEESLIVVEYDGRHKVVKASEMADVDPGNPMFGQEPRITAFKGEQALTSAMIDIVEGRKSTVGYLLGHREPPLPDKQQPAPNPFSQEQPNRSPISVLHLVLENENTELKPLNLFEVGAIPADTRTVFINAPQYDLSEREIQLLRDFWEKQGRLLVLLDPAAKTPRLTAFLNEIGVRVNDDRLMAMVKTGIQEVALTRDVQARFLAGSPITEKLAGATALLLGGTSSLTLEQDRVKAANVRLQPLIQAERGYWAETNYLSTDQEAYRASAAANAASNAVHTIGASVEKGGSGDNRVQANSSRMVVVSNATFVQDAALTRDQQALDFVSGSLNWLMNREELIGIAPKVPRTLTFTLSEEALRTLRWLVLLAMPGAAAVLGLLIWWRRRA